MECVQEVADALFEGVLPRSANDVLPSSEAGIIVSVVDKLDSLVGLAAAGCLPTSGADRYGLRRITYGLLQTLIGNDVRTSLSKLVSTAAAVQPVDASDAIQQDIVEFATRRLEQYILDQGTIAEQWAPDATFMHVLLVARVPGSCLPEFRHGQGSGHNESFKFTWWYQSAATIHCQECCRGATRGGASSTTRAVR